MGTDVVVAVVVVLVVVLVVVVVELLVTTGAIVKTVIWPIATVVVVPGTVAAGSTGMIVETVIWLVAIVVVVVGTESIVTDAALSAAAGPVFPFADTLLAARRATTVPSDVHTTETVIVVPVLADGVNTHPVAVPVLEKSPDARPLMLLLNTSE